jgi:hypothetical protein
MILKLANMILKRKIFFLIIAILLFITPQIIDQYRYNYVNKNIIFKEESIIRSITIDGKGIIFQQNIKYQIIIQQDSNNKDIWNINLIEVK